MPRICILAVLLGGGLLGMAVAAGAEEAAVAGATAAAWGWKPSVVGQANLTQNTFDNWTQGGTNSLAWQGTVLAEGTDQQSDYTWANTGKFAYGESRLDGEDFRKTADEIRLESIFTYNLPIIIKPYVAVRAESQFATGYKYEGNSRTAISGFMDPGYIRESLGVGYGDEVFKTRLGFAVRETITSLYPQYADNPDTPEIEKTKVEPGLESVTNFKWNLSELLVYSTELSLFSNCRAVDQIVVRWDNLLSASVAKYVSVNFNLQLLYDRTSSVARQISQTLALGLTYTLL